MKSTLGKVEIRLDDTSYPDVVSSGVAVGDPEQIHMTAEVGLCTPILDDYVLCRT